MTSTTCCCCIQLRCGTVTIGVLLALSHGLEALAGIGGAIAVSRTDFDLDYEYVASLKASFYTSLTINSAWLVLDILLLRGVVTERPLLVLIWLCWTLPISALLVVVAIGLVCVAAQYSGVGVIVAACLVLFNYLVLCYWAVVVLTYYRSMKTTAQRRRGQVAPAPILAYGQPVMVTADHQQRNPTSPQPPEGHWSSQPAGRSPVQRY